MASGRLLALICLLPLAACATAWRPQSTADTHGDPSGGCATPPVTPGLLLESRPDEGVFRVSNRTGRRIDIHYDQREGFGDYQMFFVRFRDRDGTLLDDQYGSCGWRTQKEVISEAHRQGPRPPRQTGLLSVPGGGSITIRRDLAALASRLATFGALPPGPCKIQVRLYGYPDPRSWRIGGAVSEWQPAPCPPRVG